MTREADELKEGCRPIRTPVRPGVFAKPRNPTTRRLTLTADRQPSSSLTEQTRECLSAEAPGTRRQGIGVSDKPIEVMIVELQNAKLDLEGGLALRNLNNATSHARCLAQCVTDVSACNFCPERRAAVALHVRRRRAVARCLPARRIARRMEMSSNALFFGWNRPDEPVTAYVRGRWQL
jgi:hypothetical protein